MLARIFQYYEGFNHFRREFRGQGFLHTIDGILTTIFPVQNILSGQEPLGSVHQKSLQAYRLGPNTLVFGIGLCIALSFILMFLLDQRGFWF